MVGQLSCFHILALVINTAMNALLMNNLIKEYFIENLKIWCVMCRNPFIKTLELSKLLKHQGQKTIVQITILILVLWVHADSLKTAEYLKNHLICFSIELLESSWICRTIVCCCSVTKSCLTLWYSMNCTMPGFLVPQHLLEYALTHVHWVGDAIQPSHPLYPLLLMPSVFTSIRVFSLSQFFASSGQIIGTSASASIFSMTIRDWFPLDLTGLISLMSKGLSRVFSSTVQKHQFFSLQISLWFNTHIHTWLLEKS